MTKLKAKYKLHASRVDRIAVVDKPAVPDAQIVVFKRLEEIEKGSVAFQDLPLADKTRAWDSEKAKKRIFDWATEEGKINFSKAKKGFMWYDSSNADKLGSYKLPYADVIDGQLKAVPRAVTAIVSVLAGGRGGVDIPMEDKKKVLSHVKKYYEKMGMDFPDITLKSIDKFLESGLIATFVFKSTAVAVDALQETVLNAIYTIGEGESAEKGINTAFKDFLYVLNEVLAKVITVNKQDVQDEDKLTEDDIVKPFERGLGWVSLSETFLYFRGTVSYLMLAYDRVVEPEKTVKKVTNSFKDFVIKNSTYIVQNKGELFEDIEKEGRIISSARLRKLKETLAIISEIVEEAENRYEKSYKEEHSMEFKQEHLDMLEKTSAEVTKISESVSGFEKSLKEAGFLKTEAERKAESDAKIEAEKKADEARIEAEKKADEARIEAEKKAKEEAEAKEQADLEKRFKDLGLEGDVSKEAVEKKEQEIAQEKSKFVSELPARLEGIEKAVASFTKFVEVVSKRFGVKASVAPDEQVATKKKSDPFGEALRG